MTDYDRIITIDVESGGKISGIALATGNYLEAGLHDGGKLLILYICLLYTSPSPRDS